MNRIRIDVSQDASCRGNVDALCSLVPQLTYEWSELLLQAEGQQTETLFLSYCSLSSVPSRNFQVIGQQLQIVNRFLLHHTYPAEVHITCADEEEALIYRKIYNFYIPKTKEERLPV